MLKLARLLGDRDTDLRGNEILMRTPKVLVEVGTVQTGMIWKIKKARFGLRTSPIAWETERNKTLRSLVWTYDHFEFRLLPYTGSPFMWSIILFRPGDDPQVKSSGDELIQSVVITYVDDLLIAVLLSG